MTLLMHLRMTGTLLYDAAAGTPYRRVLMTLDDGHTLSFCDPRRFGTGELAVGSDARDDFLDARLGIEPLGPDFTTEHLRILARGRRAPVKAFLLDQRRVAGVGNIYADEALFRAQIHPLTPAGRLKRAQLEALRDAVRLVLEAGIDAGGSTIDDFRHADGVRGSFQDEFLVHRRARRAVPGVRGRDRQARRGRPRDLRLPELPAPAARRASPITPRGGLTPAREQRPSMAALRACLPDSSASGGRPPGGRGTRSVCAREIPPTLTRDRVPLTDRPWWSSAIGWWSGKVDTACSPRRRSHQRATGRKRLRELATL